MHLKPQITLLVRKHLLSNIATMCDAPLWLEIFQVRYAPWMIWKLSYFSLVQHLAVLSQTQKGPDFWVLLCVIDVNAGLFRPPFFRFLGLIWGPILGTCFGPHFGYHFWSRFWDWPQKEIDGPKSGSKNGTQNGDQKWYPTWVPKFDPKLGPKSGKRVDEIDQHWHQ